MKGMPNLRSLLFVLFPLVGACSSPQSIDVGGRLDRVLPAVHSAV